MSSWETLAGQEGVGLHSVKQKCKVFILRTHENVVKYTAFRSDRANDKVKLFVVNLTKKHLNPEDKEEALRVRCKICNKSCGYEKYVVHDGEIVETSAAPVSVEQEKEPHPHIQNPDVLGEAYMKRWRLRPDGTPKTEKELREQW